MWATACASAPPLPEGLGGHVALEAWRGASSLHLKYNGPDGLVYATADWRGQLDLPPGPPPETVSVVVVEPGETGRTPWSGRPDSARRLAILHAAEFAKFRDRVLAERVPRGGREAVVVEMGDSEIALYYDAAGRFRSIEDGLPEEVEIRAHYSLEEYLALAPGTLERLLFEQGIEAREVLFNTGDLGDNALPFLYVNLDTNVGAFVKVRRVGDQSTLAAPVIPITRSITHLLRSHTTGLVNRPMTSLTRLLFALTHAATDTLVRATPRFGPPQPAPPLSGAAAMDLAAWESELDRITGRGAQRGRLRFLIDGEAFFTRLERALRGARESALIRIYIFDNDDYALEIADLLRERSRGGVDVKILVDGVGTLAASVTPPTELPDDYRPPPSIEEHLEQRSRVAVRRLPNPFLTGDHTKVIVVDEERAFLGGMNIGREYRYEWHDMMVELNGPVVARLADDFDVAWSAAGPLGDLAELFARFRPRRVPPSELGYPVRILYTSPTSSEIRAAQLEAIRRSRRYVYVENAYLTDDAFLQALVRARHRGVDVRVIIPLESDQGQLTRDNILTANALFENGIRVYIYPGMSHLKAAVYDGWACLGSANLDQLSLRINKETNIATSEPVAVEALLEALFERDFASSPEMREAFAERWVDSLWELVGDYFF